MAVYHSPEEALAANAEQQRALQLAIEERQRAHEREIEAMRERLPPLLHKAAELKALRGLPRRTMNDLPTHLLSRILLSATAHDNLLVHVSSCARVCTDWKSVVAASAAYLRSGYPQRSASRRMLCMGEQTQREVVLTRISRKLQAAWTNGGELDVAAPPAPIGDLGAAALSAAVSALPKLRLRRRPFVRFDVDGNELTSAGMVPIAVMLRGLCQLQVLDVRHNPALGDAGLSTLAAAVPNTLLQLNFAGTGCGNAGMVAVAKALPALTRLKTLRCGSNPAIGQAGWAALGAALVQPIWGNSFTGAADESLRPSIELFAPHCIGMSDAGLASLVAGLRCVKSLDVTACGIGNVGVLALAAALPICRSAASVDLRQNDVVTTETRAALAAAVDLHPNNRLMRIRW